MSPDADADARAIRSGAHELTGAAADFDPLIERIGDAGCVLLGEATHGTREFYAVRAHITRRLIEEQGFAAVAVEADWPAAHRAGRWASGADDDPDAQAALAGFTRFPRWMWRNREVERFLHWLREHNATVAAQPTVGCYGLDLYSLSSEVEVVDPLVAPQRRTGQPPPADQDTRGSAANAQFFAAQDARLVRNAERYHGALSRVGPEAWNLRSRHMAETLDALRTHLRSDGAPGRLVVWAHNSHVGDGRATEHADLEQVTLGQLAREAYGPQDVVLVGLSTFTGAVTAASRWGGPATTMPLSRAREDSHDALLHATGLANLMIVTGDDGPATAALHTTRLQRAIGAIYRPETERIRHYVFAAVARQLDAVIHLDTTSALEPLEPDPGRQREGLPQAYPTGV